MAAGPEQAGGRRHEDPVLRGLHHVQRLLVGVSAVEDGAKSGADGPLDRLRSLGMAGQPDTRLSRGLSDRLRLRLGIHQRLGPAGGESLVAGHQELDGVAADRLHLVDVGAQAFDGAVVGGIVAGRHAHHPLGALFQGGGPEARAGEVAGVDAVAQRRFEPLPKRAAE